MFGWRYVPGIAGIYSGIFTGYRPDSVYVVLLELYAACGIAAEKPTQHGWMVILATALYFMLATTAATCDVFGFIPFQVFQPAHNWIAASRVLISIAFGLPALVYGHYATGSTLFALGAALVCDAVWPQKTKLE